MATMPIKNDTRLSFAKVAASGGKENVALAAGRISTSSAARETRKDPTESSKTPNGNQKEAQSVSNTASVANPRLQPTQEVYTEATKASDAILSGSSSYDSGLAAAVSAINIHGPTPSLVVNGSGNVETSSKDGRTEPSLDDPYQRADSGSELGTKPASLDGKSITSGTTFALDEKESLRPDDSASVKAAEEDDTFSGRGSIVAGSRIGSEAAARAYRAQNFELSDRRTVAQSLEHRDHDIITPQSGSSGPHVPDGTSPKPLVGPAGTPEGFDLFYKQTPDDKLLEALESQKDRLFLLRLEQSLIEFVKNSKEPYIDLPPCNSFCRLLTHKLADYYHMTHQFDAVAGSVRIFRTPFCRLPQTLTSFSTPLTSGHTPPPSALPAMKIMRRGGDNGGSLSKAASESGSDSKDKSLTAKEKLSREEREAAYNKARERIFGSSGKSSDATAETDDSNDMSRSSSVSTKDKSGGPKRGKQGKQRRDDSENFDVRSQYTPYFPPSQQMQVQVGWGSTPQYAPVAIAPFGNTMQSSYSGTSSPLYAPPTQQYHPTMMGPNGLQTFNQIPQRPGPPPFVPHGAPLTAYGSPSQAPLQQPQPWPQAVYQSPYQPRMGGQPPSTIPYPYGQLPSTANSADPKSQHPIPGSFNRHAFNPKTQSFVPGGGSGQQPVHPSPHMPYNNFPQPQQYGASLGYNMSRQGSNTSLPSYHASPHLTARPMMPNMNLAHQNPPSAYQGMSSSNGQPGSHLPHFGNASTLPPKPPPAA